MSMDLKSRYEARPSGIRPPIISGSFYAPSDDTARALFKWAVIASVLIHVALFAVTFPSIGRPVPQPAFVAQRTLHLLRPVRFKPPEPAAARPAAMKRKARRVPIPDPTPDEPEPLVDRYQALAPDLIVDEIGDLLDLVGIPAAPPSLGGGTGPPVWPGEGITPPEKIVAPMPAYTEEARMARVQGVVILRGVVDVHGSVTHLQVLKGLPEGLTESALRAVSAWRYEPARRGAEPVAVYFNFTIRFSLQ